jgi:DNA repair exonuclease SbcCD ATPase subunit
MNSGKVQLDVIIKGKDEVAAMLANIEKQAKQTEKQLKSVSDSDLKPDINGLSAVRDTLGNTVEAVDKAEERFNKLIGALGFVGAAFAILPAIYDFAKELLNVETASDRAKQSIGRLSEILIQAKKDFNEFNKERAATEGLRLALEIEDKIVKASDAGAEVARERIELESQLAQILEEQTKNDYQKRLSSLQTFVAEAEKLGGYSRDIMNANVQINHLEVYRTKELKEIAFVQDRLNEAKSAEQRYAEEILNLEQDKTGALKSQLKELKELTKESRILYFLSGGVFGSKPEKKPGGAAPSKPKPTDFEIQMDPWSKAIGKQFGITRDEWTQRRIDLRIETDVVLKKRGEDIEKGFADYIQNALEISAKKLKAVDAGEVLQASFERSASTIKAITEREIQDSVDAFAKIVDPIEKASQQMDRFAQSTNRAFDAFSELADEFADSESQAEKAEAALEKVEKQGKQAQDQLSKPLAKEAKKDSEKLNELAEKFRDISEGIAGVQTAMDRYQSEMSAIGKRLADDQITFAASVLQGESAKTKAIIGGSTEGLAAIGKLIGGLKAEYALRSAGELAMGFATLANPVESAGHFVAAGLFAVAAGKAASGGGGKGASAAGADNETPATSSSLGYGDGGGQRTVVYNFSTLLADRQQVHRAIRDSELVGQRNGYGRRRGV